jgi:preprotein translocase subunit SecE
VGFFKTIKHMAKQKGLALLTKTPKTIYRFIFEARDELKKVSWPDRETTTRYTIIVIIASVVIGAFTGGIDYLFTLILELIV